MTSRLTLLVGQEEEGVGAVAFEEVEEGEEGEEGGEGQASLWIHFKPPLQKRETRALLRDPQLPPEEVLGAEEGGEAFPGEELHRHQLLGGTMQLVVEWLCPASPPEEALLLEEEAPPLEEQRRCLPIEDQWPIMDQLLRLRLCLRLREIRYVFLFSERLQNLIGLLREWTWTWTSQISRLSLPLQTPSLLKRGKTLLMFKFWTTSRKSNQKGLSSSVSPFINFRS